MRRHRFEPAALVMGLVVLTLAVFFLLDAGGVWDISSPRRSLPIVAAGLALAAVTAVVTQSVRIVRALRSRPRRGARG